MRQVEEAAFAAFLNRTLEEHAHFVIRNVTPRSVFANLLALMWLVCAGELVRWVTKMRRNADKDAALRAGAGAENAE